MENSYQYFKRDLSWLSFNYRVLLEAEDDTLPIYERIKFLSIYSSNLEEFYEIRVAEHRGVIMKKNYSEESAAEAEETLAAYPPATGLLPYFLGEDIAGIESPECLLIPE